MHEHIFVLSPEVMDEYGSTYWDEDVRIADAKQKLTELKALGVDTIVDLTVMGIGRNIRRIAKVCDGLDMNVIVATGLYTRYMVPMHFYLQGPGTAFGGDDPLVQMFIDDIETGVPGTGVK